MINPTYVVDVGRNVILAKDIIGETHLSEYLEGVFHHIIHFYWSCGNWVISDDILDELIEVVHSITNEDVFAIYSKAKTDDFYGDEQYTLDEVEMVHDELITTVMKLVNAIEDYILTISRDNVERLNNIDVKILDKMTGILAVTAYFAPYVK